MKVKLNKILNNKNKRYFIYYYYWKLKKPMEFGNIIKKNKEIEAFFILQIVN